MDTIARKPIHIDLREIAKGIEISAHVPVHAKGIAFGVKNQGGCIGNRCARARSSLSAKEPPEGVVGRCV